MNSSYLHSSYSQPQSPSHYAAPSPAGNSGHYSHGRGAGGAGPTAIGMGGVTSGTSGGTLRRFPSNAASKKNKGPPENQPSLLLSPQENLAVFQVLGKGRQTLSTAVVQLLYPHTEDSDWHLRDVGVLCFVRDSNRRSFFLEIVSLRQMRVTFSQEFYDEFVYRQPAPNLRFITFEGDEFMVGLSFASADEMRDFRNTLDTKMAAKRKKQIERQSRLYDQASTYPSIPSPGGTGNPNGNGIRSPTITAANMHALVTGLGAPISPYATARPSPLTLNGPMSPSTKFNTVSGGVSPYVAAMGGAGRGQGSQGQGQANKSSFGTVRAQQSPYAMNMTMGANGNGGAGGYAYGKAHTNVPMAPITIPKIHTSVVTAGPGGTEASQPIISNITLSAPPKGKNKTGAGRFVSATLGRRNSIASTLPTSKADKMALETKDKGPNNKSKPDKKGKKKKDKKEKLTKADIGAPTNFVHVQHTGFDIKKGYTNEVRNEKYKALFDKIGISSTELQDQNTAAFIYQFIDDYEQKQAQTPPPPSTPASKTQNHQSQNQSWNQLQAETWGDNGTGTGTATGSHHHDNQSYNRQQPPAQHQQRHHQQQQPQSQQVKRPAPVGAPQPPSVPLRAFEKRQAPTAPIAPMPSPAANQQQQQQPRGGYNAQAATAIPPPPPPPFPVAGNGNGHGYGHHPTSPAMGQGPRQMPMSVQPSGGSPPPPPPPMPMPMPSSDRQEVETGRQRGPPVAPGMPPSMPQQTKAPPKAPEGGRVNLLMEIQAGISLRKVEPGEGGSGGGRNSVASPESMDGLAVALHRALAERSKAIHSDSSSSEDEDGGDDGDSDESDEWK